MKALKASLFVLVAIIVIGVVAIYSGLMNFAADEPHWDLTTRIIESAREHSISSQSDDVAVPNNLADPKLIASGAGEYAEMCTACHLAPGMKDTELRVGLYPRPPNLAEHGGHRTPQQLFWIIKHGLKLSGMPAWGLTHDDERIWSMVAFLGKLPELSPDAYREMIESSGGHHHGDDGEHSHVEDAETETHAHGAAHEQDEAAAEPARKMPAPHEHAPGTPPHGHKSGNSMLPAGAAAAASIVDRFQSSLSSGDTKAAANLLYPSVLIFEGGAAERSREEYASHHLQADAKFLEGAKVKVLARSGDALGELAWVATESELTTAGAMPTRVVTTETMILKRETPGWRIAHIHWSSRKKE